MKKILFIITVIFCLVLVAGCPESPPDAGDAENILVSSEESSVLAGVVEP